MHLTSLRQAHWRVYACADSPTRCRLLDTVCGLDANHQNKFASLIQRVVERGPHAVPSDCCHKIDGDIWQFRAGDFRVLWFYDAGRIVICTHGFVKKKGKTPPREIQAARTTYAAYRTARDEGTLTCQESTS